MAYSKGADNRVLTATPMAACVRGRPWGERERGVPLPCRRRREEVAREGDSGGAMKEAEGAEAEGRGWCGRKKTIEG
jgi:hypothetical protein